METDGAEWGSITPEIQKGSNYRIQGHIDIGPLFLIWTSQIV